MSTVAWVAAAFVAGSVPFSYLTVRWAAGIDLRDTGSGNPGATNAVRAAGVGAGMLALALDIGKGALPVLLAQRLGVAPGVVAAVAVAAVLGHVYSPFLRFRGGKGVATAVGSLGALAPIQVAIGVALFGAVVLTTRYVSLGSLVLVGSVPATLAAGAGLTGAAPHWTTVAAAVAIALLVLARHAGNLARLRSGSEPRFGRSNEEMP